jgi:hypothetical protein
VTGGADWVYDTIVMSCGPAGFRNYWGKDMGKYKYFLEQKDGDAVAHCDNCIPYLCSQVNSVYGFGYENGVSWGMYCGSDIGMTGDDANNCFSSDGENFIRARGFQIKRYVWSCPQQ